MSLSDGKYPVVSGYTKNESFIKSALGDLRGDVNANQDRVGRIEGRQEAYKERIQRLEKQIEKILERGALGDSGLRGVQGIPNVLGAPGAGEDFQTKKMENRTKVILAIIGGIVTITTTIVAIFY